jgi:DNA-binding XRE family transcriptional regulator
MKKRDDITSLNDFKEEVLGKKGSAERDKYESEFEAFKLGVLIRDARMKANMTQEELAAKVGTKRTYISRIEHDSSDIRLSTLMRIITQGLGGRLDISINFK